MKSKLNEEFERLCREKGLRLTGPRRVILDVLATASDHPDAIDVHRRAMSIDPSIAIATVYRTVRLLQDSGILERDVPAGLVDCAATPADGAEPRERRREACERARANAS
ncbi:Fur family transcriptional regulator [Bradyrhizobium diversitatis]|uniref:Transcriptional repressor n=1 Tax=Bradyrhizobium diversitatis TaxID=2755406 RepID=A0ABS0NUR5_9BRAD|nr:transcriptional repressor [Bradyrhizobium diversitatis]MBH5384753.1 transcriptional repressor [Bradyrhizobium diversitatis]